jgi:hypothetical protein
MPAICLEPCAVFSFVRCHGSLTLAHTRCAALQIYAKLTGGHKGAVTGLLTLCGDKLGAPDMLLSSAADGSVAVWDPSRTIARGTDREMAPKHTFKAHDSAVKGMALFTAYMDETPTPPTVKLVTVGAMGAHEVGGCAGGGVSLCVLCTEGLSAGVIIVTRPQAK